MQEWILTAFFNVSEVYDYKIFDTLELKSQNEVPRIAKTLELSLQYSPMQGESWKHALIFVWIEYEGLKAKNYKTPAILFIPWF